MEIERKFLLPSSVVDGLFYYKEVPKDRYLLYIEQHYLPSGIRIRKETISGVSTTCKITVKGITEFRFEREEWEKRIPQWVFDELKNTPNIKSIEKSRFTWEKGKLKFFLDKFKNNNKFSILEIEFPDHQSAIAFDPTAVELPIKKEITYDLSYYNYNMAK